ncbi:MAG: peptidase T [Faecalimonas sp.]|nr:peptidase T [Faecalimonas sp.]
MKAYERLLKYVVVRTPSNEEATTVPTTECQFELAKMLEQELKEIGVTDVTLNDKCFVYAKLPATAGCENAAKLGFLAHMDTVSDFCDGTITPVLTENYDGKDLVLGTSGRVLRVKDFPHLSSLAGRTLITSDGTTILGVDDKAGIAEIMTAIEYIIKEKIPHGQICIAFTPDEEAGTGSHSFDVPFFNADFAYTLDGDAEGEIQYENFNACSAKFEIEGFSVHPGSSKDTMINACLVAMEINDLLPGAETPRETEGFEGFYHLCDMTGDVGHATLNYIVRDHDANRFENRKNALRHIADTLNEKWGAGTVTLTIEEQYRNMSEIIQTCMHLIENAKQAAFNVGITPVVTAIRGGTDGSHLSFVGLPCPNLGTGGYAFHGPYEHTTVEGMDKATEMIVELVKLYAE